MFELNCDSKQILFCFLIFGFTLSLVFVCFVILLNRDSDYLHYYCNFI